MPSAIDPAPSNSDHYERDQKAAKHVMRKLGMSRYGGRNVDYHASERYKAAFKAAPMWRIQEYGFAAGVEEELKQMDRAERFAYEMKKQLGKLI